MSNIITIDLENEITQAEYCRRNPGETLGNLAPKLKRLSVRDIPELGIKLINISHPSFDSIRIESPPVREHTVTELSSLFSNLLAKLKSDSNEKDAIIQSFDKTILDLQEKLENLSQDNEQLKEVCQTLQKEVEEKAECINSKDQEIAILKNNNIREIEKLNSEREFFRINQEQKDKEYSELKEELKKLKLEKEEIEKRIVQTSISEEFKIFRKEIVSIINNINPPKASTKNKQPKNL